MNTACTGPSSPSNVDVALERVDLPAEGVAPHGHIDRLRAAAASRPGNAGIEDLGGQQDHPGARTVGGHAVGQPGPQRLEQFELAQQVAHRGGLAAGDHQRVDGVEFAAPAHGDRLGARFAQRGQVLAGVALQRQHTDARRAHSVGGVKSRL